MNQPPAMPKARVNRHPFAWSFTMTVPFFVSGIVLVLATLGLPSSAAGVGRAVGLFLIPAVASAVAIGLAARSSHSLWRSWRYLLLGSIVAAGFLVLTVLSRVIELIR